jgi:hypothetical protein
MAPQSVARGAPRSGDRAAAGMPDRAKMRLGCQQSATGSHLPPEETASPCAVSPDFTATRWGRGFASGLPCQAPSEGAPRSAARGALRSGDRAAEGMLRPHRSIVGAQASRYGVASSSGRNCSALRGRAIRVVAFRASHPAKPPSRQRRLVQGFPKTEIQPPSQIIEGGEAAAALKFLMFPSAGAICKFSGTWTSSIEHAACALVADAAPSVDSGRSRVP